LTPTLSDRARLACGAAAAIADSFGRTFQPDDVNAGGLPWTIVPADPANPTAIGLYSTLRFGSVLAYSASVNQGTAYLVRIHLCEPNVQIARGRLFDVVIDGVRVMANIDPFAEAGLQRPYARTVVVEAVEPLMTITLSASVRSAVISGLEIVPLLTSLVV
jgi:hypothetical protein